MRPTHYPESTGNMATHHPESTGNIAAHHSEGTDKMRWCGREILSHESPPEDTDNMVASHPEGRFWAVPDRGLPALPSLPGRPALSRSAPGLLTAGASGKGAVIDVKSGVDQRVRTPA